MRVIIESPYAGEVEKNIVYARRCMLDSLMRGETPLAFHLLYTQVLDDTKPQERNLGITASQNWYEYCDFVAVYVDRGVSGGMLAGIELARSLGKPYEYRVLP